MVSTGNQEVTASDPDSNFPVMAPNLNALLKAYANEVTGDPPPGAWNQQQCVFFGSGVLRFVLGAYTDVLGDETPRREIQFTVRMLDHNRLIRFETLLDIIRNKIRIHFTDPLDNQASIRRSVEAAYKRGKLWLAYDGIEELLDEHGPYYVIKFTD